MDEYMVAGRVNVLWMLFFPDEDATGWDILHDVDAPLIIRHASRSSGLSLLFLYQVVGYTAG